MNRTPIARACCLTALLLSLAACEDSGPPPAPSTDKALTSTTQAGARPFTFINPGEHHSLAPQRVSYLADVRIADALFDPLLRNSVPEAGLEGGAAERWEVSPDGKTYRFHLRRDGKWSNGDPVTAHDFAFAWGRALLPDTAAEYASMFFTLRGGKAFYDWRAKQTTDYTKQPDKSPAKAAELWAQAQQRLTAEVGVRALDDFTLEVTLERPTTYFLELVAFPTFAPVHTATVRRAMAAPDAQTGLVITSSDWVEGGKLISNGAYRLAEHRARHLVRLEANPHHWDRARLGTPVIVERIVENPDTQMLAYSRGEVDWLPGIPTASPLAAELIRAGREGKRSDVFTGVAAGTYFYKFNCAPTLVNGLKNPLADARVRRALSLAIDRKTLVEKVTGVFQPIALSLTPPDAIPGYSPPVEDGVSFDPAAARELLAQAGHDQGKGLEGLDILYNTSGQHGELAQAIASGWKKHLGLQIAMRPMTDKLYQAEQDRRTFTIARAGWYGDYRDPTTFVEYLAPESGYNDGQWRNAEFEGLITRAAAETDRAKAFGLLRQAESIILREQALAPLFFYVNLELWRPERVQGLHLNPWNRYRLDRIRPQAAAAPKP